MKPIVIIVLFSSFLTAQVEISYQDISDVTSISSWDNTYSSSVLQAEPKIYQENSESPKKGNRMAAHCYCRIGNDRGPALDEYPNALKDFGQLRRYTGAGQQSKKNQADCGRICSAKAMQYAVTMSDEALCGYIGKEGHNRIVAYSKVGTKKWTIRQTLRSVSCCKNKVFTCPNGTHSEDKNFPGMCAKHLCTTSEPGARFYNKDGSPWGFIYKDGLYKLFPGKVTSSGWKSCF